MSCSALESELVTWENPLLVRQMRMEGHMPSGYCSPNAQPLYSNEGYDWSIEHLHMVGQRDRAYLRYLAVNMGSSLKPCLMKKPSALWSTNASRLSYWPTTSGSFRHCNTPCTQIDDDDDGVGWTTTDSPAWAASPVQVLYTFSSQLGDSLEQPSSYQL